MSFPRSWRLLNSVQRPLPLPERSDVGRLQAVEPDLAVNCWVCQVHLLVRCRASPSWHDSFEYDIEGLQIRQKCQVTGAWIIINKGGIEPHPIHPNETVGLPSVAWANPIILENFLQLAPREVRMILPWASAEAEIVRITTEFRIFFVYVIVHHIPRFLAIPLLVCPHFRLFLLSLV